MNTYKECSTGKFARHKAVDWPNTIPLSQIRHMPPRDQAGNSGNFKMSNEETVSLWTKISAPQGHWTHLKTQISRWWSKSIWSCVWATFCGEYVWMLWMWISVWLPKLMVLLRVQMILQTTFFIFSQDVRKMYASWCFQEWSMLCTVCWKVRVSQMLEAFQAVAKLCQAGCVELRPLHRAASCAVHRIATASLRPERAALERWAGKHHQDHQCHLATETNRTEKKNMTWHIRIQKKHA